MIRMIDCFQVMVIALHWHSSRVIIEAFDVDLHFGSALPSHVLVPARPRNIFGDLRCNTPDAWL